MPGRSTRPSACRAKRAASPPCTGSGRSHGQPPKPVRGSRERLLDLVLGVHHERAVLRDRLADRASLQHQDLGTRRRRRRSGAGCDRRRRRRPVSLATASPSTAHRAFEHVEHAHGVGARRGGQRRSWRPAAIATCQIAASASGREPTMPAAGVGGVRPASVPAMTVTVVPRPASSMWSCCGMSSPQNIVKYGSTILSAAGRFIQIWNSSTVLCPRLIEQREHLAVHDAAAGGHPLHVAATEAGGGAHRVAVIDEALAGERDGLEAAVRVLGEPGHGAAVVHAPAVDAARSRCRCRGRRATPAGRIGRCPPGSGRGGARRTGTDRRWPTGIPAAHAAR